MVIELYNGTKLHVSESGSTLTLSLNPNYPTDGQKVVSCPMTSHGETTPY